MHDTAGTIYGSMIRRLSGSFVVQGGLSTFTGGRVKLGWWSRGYVSGDRPIVVGGCGRSGTTLLRTILNAHRDIACSQESGVFTSLSKINFDNISNSLALGRAEVVRIYRRSACRVEFIERLYRAYLERVGKLRWAEKDPNAVKAIGRIFAGFPDGRFIHIIRDGRDVACSLRTHPKYRVVDGARVPVRSWNPIEQCIQRWMTDVGAGLEWRGDPRYMEVRYEELIARPGETMRAVLGFIGENWDDSILRSYTSADVPITHPEIARGLSRAAVGRWRQDLTGSDRACFKRLANDLLVELGYASDDAW